MKHVSEFSGHDRSEAKLGSLPTWTEMRNDIDKLRAYNTALKKRRSAVKDRREALESPQPAQIA